MELVYLSRWLPYPANNGSKLRIYNILKRLAARHHKIHLITFYEPGEDYAAAALHLGQFCSEIVGVAYQGYQAVPKRRASLAVFNPRPRSVTATYSPEVASSLETILESGEIGAVIASQIDMAVYGLQAKLHGVPALLEELEVGTLYELAKVERNFKIRLRFSLTWFKLARYIRYLARYYQVITVVSEKERGLIARLVANTPLKVIPNGADLSFYRFNPYQAKTRSPQLIFNGALTFGLNFEAVSYFLSHIFPLIRQTEADLELVITGDYSGVDLARLVPGQPVLPPGVRLTGFMPDIRPLVTQSSICVVPLLRGGGTRLKILEAFALGTPVVATSKAVEGLKAQHNEHLLIADTPAEFAKAVLKIRANPALALHLSQNARHLVEARFDWDSIAARLDQLLTEMAGSTPSQALTT